LNAPLKLSEHNKKSIFFTTTISDHVFETHHVFTHHVITHHVLHTMFSNTMLFFNREHTCSKPTSTLFSSPPSPFFYLFKRQEKKTLRKQKIKDVFIRFP